MIKDGTINNTDEIRFTLSRKLKKGQNKQIPKTFAVSGTEKEKEMWVREVINQDIELRWGKYDNDKNGNFDEIESYNFFTDMVAKNDMNKLGYYEVFKK